MPVFIIIPFGLLSFSSFLRLKLLDERNERSIWCLQYFSTVQELVLGGKHTWTKKENIGVYKICFDYVSEWFPTSQFFIKWQCFIKWLKSENCESFGLHFISSTCLIHTRNCFSALSLYYKHLLEMLEISINHTPTNVPSGYFCQRSYIILLGESRFFCYGQKEKLDLQKESFVFQ